MAEVLSALPKTNPKFSFMEQLAVGGTKMLSERALAKVPFVGNGTFRSGAIKMGAAYGAYKLVPGSVGSVVSTALSVDAVEDLVTAAWNRWMGGSSSEQESSAVAPL